VLGNLLWVSGAILLGILLLHPRILAAMRNFDARNRERLAAEREEKRDALAHFRRTLALAEEQVETVQTVTVDDPRTGTAVTRYVFEGETFASADEAEQVRAEKLRAIAKSFYRDLPAALRARREDDRIKGA